MSNKFEITLLYAIVLLVVIGAGWLLHEADKTINDAVKNYMQKPQYECILTRKEITINEKQ